MCIKFLQHPIVTPVPSVDGFVTISRSDYLSMLSIYGVRELAVSPVDAVVRLSSKSVLDTIAQRLVYPADWYVADIWDCDDYALQAMLDAGRKFGVTARMMIGQMELGSHSFIGSLDIDQRLWLLESNAGYPWAGQWFAAGIPFDDMVTAYIPQYVFI